jgi:uncharacterized protein YdbL (DUF1318 family)
MKKRIFVVIFVAALSFGCARVRVEAPKEPIKVDISMRLDVYQHVAKDIDDIENIVSGGSQPKPAAGPQSMLPSFVGIAHAEEGMGSTVESAALRRKNRRAQISALEANGVIGENKVGLISIQKPGSANDATESLVIAENRDRMEIYRGIASKNGTMVQDVQKLYSKRLQKDAPAGTPIEVLDENSGRSSWQVK